MDEKTSDFSRLRKLVLKHLRVELRGTMEHKYRKFEERTRKQEEHERSRAASEGQQQMVGYGALVAAIGVCVTLYSHTRGNN